MKCQDFEKEYLQADGHLSAQVLEHARSCRSCRELLQILNLINSAAQTPSPELDRHTVDSALACIAHSKPISRWPKRIQSFLYVAAAALILLLAVVNLERKNPVDNSTLALSNENSIDVSSLQVSSENSTDLDALWYLSREEASSELDDLELQLSLYANLF